jgi:hypothetical protein
MKSIIYTNRIKYIIALALELCLFSVFGLCYWKWNIRVDGLIVAILVGIIALLITVSGLMKPIKYIFAYDNVKFGFKQDDDVILEGYFVDIESVNHQYGLLAYQSEVASRNSDGEIVAPFLISRRNDLIIKMSGNMPVCLPHGFENVYREFLTVYKSSV